MQSILYVFSILFGMVIGSFLNVVIYRVPRKESLLRPASRCPSCQVAIKWYDNIPVASWLVLRGRCRSCETRISMRYPVVEAFTGASFGLSFWRFGFAWACLVAFFVVCILIVLALIDFDHMIIPSVISLPGAALGLGASIALNPGRWWLYLAAAGGAAMFCFLLAVFWPGGGMGGGDVTMALFVGSVLGVAGTLVAFFLAFLTGTLVGLYLLIVLKRSKKTRVPFGPFLSLGSYVALFFGGPLIDGYMNLFY